MGCRSDAKTQWCMLSCALGGIQASSPCGMSRAPLITKSRLSPRKYKVPGKLPWTWRASDLGKFVSPHTTHLHEPVATEGVAALRAAEMTLVRACLLKFFLFSPLPLISWPLADPSMVCMLATMMSPFWPP
jgi:hypothetical protein